MRFHLLGLAETPIRPSLVQCAFVPLIYNMARMVKRNGHTLIFYGPAGSDVPCDENVEIVAAETLDGSKDRSKFYYNDYRLESPAWQEFVRRGREALRARYRPGDLTLMSQGDIERFAAEESQLACEFICGYRGIFHDYKVFPSYAWMHALYGHYGHLYKPAWLDAVIPHYLEVSEFPYREDKDDFVLFLGRVVKDKGVHVAERASAAAGVRLIVAGTHPRDEGMGNAVDPEGHHVTFVGGVDHARRCELLSRARALIVPSAYLEPFGMVAIEALACGTPVIGPDWGGFSETIRDRVTGFRCRTLGEFADACRATKDLSPSDCRRQAESEYDLSVIWPQYWKFFCRLQSLARQPEPMAEAVDSERSAPGYGTHVPLLAACLLQTEGPVVELGCGWHSTPLLHSFCAAHRRPLVTADDDPDWLARFRHMRRRWHAFVEVHDWDKSNLFAQRWSVVLVDHGQGHRRGYDTSRLADLAGLIVCHDTQAPEYGYADVLASFRHRFDDRGRWPWTTVVSNSDDLSWLRSPVT